MTEKRIPRDGEQRDSDVRPSDSWIPASVIPDPEPQDGWVFRWVRTSILGQTDATHTSRMFREGWEPVRADEYPEMAGKYPTIDDGQHAGVIGVGGLMLARIPEETVEERTEYYREQTRQQMEAVDQSLMREQHPSMPIHSDRKSRVSFGGKSDG